MAITLKAMKATEQIKAESVDNLLMHLQEKKTPTNVAKVRHLSLFRYPGGKTWLVPEVRKWLNTFNFTPSTFVEPFAGGAIIGLTVAAENLAQRVHLCELDDDVAAVWSLILLGNDSDSEWLCQRIQSFEVNLVNVHEVLSCGSQSTRDRAFRTIVKNRTQRGGIMAPGAGLVKTGEAGRGLRSRWYPETLVKRIEFLRTVRNRIDFTHADAFDVIRRFSVDPNVCFLIDPPYTAGGKNAGKRLYTHNEVNHSELFALMSTVRGSVMMTYDDTREIHELARRYGYVVERIPMKNTHHEILHELIILKP